MMGGVVVGVQLDELGEEVIPDKKKSFYRRWSFWWLFFPSLASGVLILTAIILRVLHAGPQASSRLYLCWLKFYQCIRVEMDAFHANMTKPPAKIKICALLTCGCMTMLIQTAGTCHMLFAVPSVDANSI